ncbi:MAG: hypothetical protein DVB28_001159 [Verrucomicrobia bacterium]|nr:MAG: hypothetical protein DVB28_001159 [Verrucomicrobiota bacterium]
MVDGNEFGSVRERCLHLNVVDHIRNALHDILTFEESGAETHEIWNRPAVARSFKYLVREDRYGLRVIEFKASRLAPPGEVCRNDDEEFFLLAGREVHDEWGF